MFNALQTDNDGRLPGLRTEEERVELSAGSLLSPFVPLLKDKATISSECCSLPCLGCLASGGQGEYGMDGVLHSDKYSTALQMCQASVKPN